MKRMKHMIALLAALATFTSQLQAQGEYYDAPPAYGYEGQPSEGQPQAYVEDPSAGAYSDGEQASYLSAALPLVAVIAAAVIIATTDNHHHHHHSSSGSSSSRSSSSSSSSHHSH